MIFSQSGTLVLNQESASDLSSCGKGVTQSKPWLSLLKKWPEASLSRGFSGHFFLEEDYEHGSYLDLLLNAAREKPNDNGTLLFCYN